MKKIQKGIIEKVRDAVKKVGLLKVLSDCGLTSTANNGGYSFKKGKPGSCKAKSELKCELSFDEKKELTLEKVLRAIKPMYKTLIDDSSLRGITHIFKR